MKAVVIGAGRVGLGCIAPILHRAGAEVVVLGRGEILQQLQAHGRVRVRTVQGMHRSDQDVPVRTVDLAAEPERAAAEIATAQLVCTAVGPRALEELAPLLVEGLQSAADSVDVIAWENMEDAGALLRREVGMRLDTPVEHGFSGAVVDRVVAQRLPATDRDPVTVVAEPTCRVVVDRGGLVRDWSTLPTVRPVDRFRAWYRAKLHCYSTGHATAAYLGQLKGYRTIHAAVADPEIASAVLSAMEERRRGLLHRYGPVVAGTREDLHRFLDRFGNAALGDTTDRVGRDVPRKLSRRDRLTGAARGARKAGVVPVHLSFAMAAALHRHLPAPPPDGPDRRRAVADLLQVRPDHELVALVGDHWSRLDQPAALLSLHVSLPAWEAPASPAPRLQENCA